MVFSSLEFILGFLPIFLLLYYLAPAANRNAVLCLGSLIFYAWGEPKYVLLLMGSILLNYFFGRLAAPKEGRREWLRKTVFFFIAAVNLGMLAVFKWAPETWALPLGVSFYTFQSLSYLADVYRGEIPAERSLLRLGTYVCMFPQLVAGPIVNYDEVSDTLKNGTWIFIETVDQGLKNFAYGMVLKVLLADRLSMVWKDLTVAGFVSISPGAAWIGALAYALQIYFDFYGYSRMAIGLGQMLGFSLPENFRIPYAAKSVREFYSRWHMTLGRWFRNYVYIPLGGSRKGWWITVRNLLIVWTLTAFWHGGSLNFLLWGMWLCFLIILEKGLAPGNLRIPAVLRHVYVLTAILLSWVFFAIPDPAELGIYLGKMFGLFCEAGTVQFYAVSLAKRYGLLLAEAVFMASPAGEQLFAKIKDRFLGMLLLTVLFWICVRYLTEMGGNPFLYFRF